MSELRFVASKWWNDTGRELMKAREYSEKFKFQSDNLNASRPGTDGYLGPSGILRGYSWSQLNEREKRSVIASYKANFF